MPRIFSKGPIGLQMVSSLQPSDVLKKHMKEPPVTQRIGPDKLEPMPGNREFGTA
jgi:hypothetical protein